MSMHIGQGVITISATGKNNPAPVGSRTESKAL